MENNEKGQSHLGDSEHTSASPKVFRTRKAELISGLSLVSLLGIYSVVRTITSDINSAIKSQNAIVERRLDRIEHLIERNREERKDAIKDIKTTMEHYDERLERRIQWLERAIPQMPR